MVFHHLWLEARMQWHQYTRTVVVINDGIFVAESRKWIRGRSWRQSGKVILVCFGLLVCLGASSFRFNLSKLRYTTPQFYGSTLTFYLLFFFRSFFLLSSFFCLSCHLPSSHPSSLFLLLLDILELQKLPPSS